MHGREEAYFGMIIIAMRKDTSLHTATRNSQLEVVQSLLNTHPTDICVRNDENLTPLHLAIRTGCVARSLLLLEQHRQNNHKIAFNWENEEDYSLLHFGALMGSWEVFKELTDLVTLPITISDIMLSKKLHGNSVLHYAVYSGSSTFSSSCLNMLNEEEQYTAITTANNVGQTSLYWAAYRGNDSNLAEMLAKIQLQCERNNHELASKLFGKDRYGYTLRHAAAISGNATCVKLVLEYQKKCPDTNTPAENHPTNLIRLSTDFITYPEVSNTGYPILSTTPLELAAFSGNSQSVRYFISELGNHINALSIGSSQQTLFIQNQIQAFFDSEILPPLCRGEIIPEQWYNLIYSDTSLLSKIKPKPIFRINLQHVVEELQQSHHLYEGVLNKINDPNTQLGRAFENETHYRHALNNLANTSATYPPERTTRSNTLTTSVTPIIKYSVLSYERSLYKALRNNNIRSADEIISLLGNERIKSLIHCNPNILKLAVKLQPFLLEKLIRILGDNAASFILRSDIFSCTLIHYASVYPNSAQVSLLLNALGEHKTEISTKKTISRRRYLQHLSEFGSIDPRLTRQRTPLQLAAYTGNVDSMRFLLEASNIPICDIFSVDEEGNTSFHLIALSTNPAGIQLLIDSIKRFDPNNWSDRITSIISMQNNNYDTVLHYAAGSGCEKCAALIVDHLSQSDSSLLGLLYQSNQYRLTPLHFAMRGNNSTILNRLLALAGENVQSLLAKKITVGDLEKVEEKYYSLNNTILHLGTKYADEGCFIIILSKIQSIEELRSLCEPNSAGETPLYLAAYYGKHKLIKQFINKAKSLKASSRFCFSDDTVMYADIFHADQITNTGHTLLHAAAASNNTACVELIIKELLGHNKATELAYKKSCFKEKYTEQKTAFTQYVTRNSLGEHSALDFAIKKRNFESVLVFVQLLGKKTNAIVTFYLHQSSILTQATNKFYDDILLRFSQDGFITDHEAKIVCPDTLCERLKTNYANDNLMLEKAIDNSSLLGQLMRNDNAWSLFSNRITAIVELIETNKKMLRDPLNENPDSQTIDAATETAVFHLNTL